MKTGIVIDKKITLKSDTTMTSNYRGRGERDLSIVVPKGTIVRYTKMVTLSGIYHTVYFAKNGIEYEANKKEDI